MISRRDLLAGVLGTPMALFGPARAATSQAARPDPSRFVEEAEAGLISYSEALRLVKLQPVADALGVDVRQLKRDLDAITFQLQAGLDREWSEEWQRALERSTEEMIEMSRRCREAEAAERRGGELAEIIDLAAARRRAPRPEGGCSA